MRANDRLRLLIVGVGGQGVLTAARILGEAALAEGVPVIVGQLHGMSQRGGSVESMVLFGPWRSSLFGGGAVDVLLALEPLEALRALPRVAKHTHIVVNIGTVTPFLLTQTGQPYPGVDGILAKLRHGAGELVAVDGPAIAESAGSARALNAAMLGALAALGALPVTREAIERAIERANPNQSAGRRAFALGAQVVLR
ncbi:MAG: 2-oxoacid:acceptor oxidoreductase family protein [Planctomycetes bacterium]|nr:2-oxoacid:acceptor oxidoreductase family protein [Planctomycetota bacterium]